MSDRLVKINKRDWPVLNQLYKLNSEKNYIAHTTIDTYNRWLQQDPDLKNVEFYCLNGDFSDGTFVVIDRVSAYVDTLSENYENVFRLVALLDFTKGYWFLNIRSEIQSIVVNAVEHAGSEILENYKTLLYYCPKEVAMNYDIQPPKGIELRPLTKLSDITRIASGWRKLNRTPDSIQMLQRIAKYNETVGAFLEDGTMVSWCFRYPTGLVGALETDKQYFGRGLGSLVAKSLSKCVAEMGHDLYTTISDANQPSLNLFKKLGFKPVGENHWITTKFSWKPNDEE